MSEVTLPISTWISALESAKDALVSRINTGEPETNEDLLEVICVIRALIQRLHEDCDTIGDSSLFRQEEPGPGHNPELRA